MGLFWDLVQQSQISDQKARSDTLQARVERLEYDLYHTRVLLHKLVTLLETRFGQDIDGDGYVG